MPGCVLAPVCAVPSVLVGSKAAILRANLVPALILWVACGAPLVHLRKRDNLAFGVLFDDMCGSPVDVWLVCHCSLLPFSCDSMLLPSDRLRIRWTSIGVRRCLNADMSSMRYMRTTVCKRIIIRTCVRCKRKNEQIFDIMPWEGAGGTRRRVKAAIRSTPLPFWLIARRSCVPSAAFRKQLAHPA